MSKVLHLEKSEDFKNLISEGTVLVDFFATWCRPCQMLGPVLDEVSEEVDFKIVKVDVDQFPELAGEYQVRSIPTMVKFEAGVAKDVTLGYKSKEEVKDFVK
ncbi:thioredoxin [Pseudostreptobacillus sp.]|jgi:thioredoxin